MRYVPVVYLLGGMLALMAIILGLRKIGRDAHRLKIRQELVRHATGESLMKRSYRLRRRDLNDTIEEKISFTARLNDEGNERIERRGLLVRRPNARAVVLICHGFMCNKDDVRFLRGTLFPRYTTLSFDFRAHGECIGGQACTLGFLEKEDVIGAVEFIRSQPDLRHKPLIVYGFSMGAVASILAQSQRGNLFDAAIWDCPFDSTDNVVRRLLDKVNISIAGYEFSLPGKSIFQKYAYNGYVQDMIKKVLKTIANLDSCDVNTMMMPVNTVEEANSITIPSFFIVCKKDTKAPVSAVMEVYLSTQGIKRLWVTNGRYHFDSFFYNPERYTYQVNQFIEGVLSREIYDEDPELIMVDEPNGPHDMFANMTKGESNGVEI
jgi:pimeloyl-ACP methyl ester carboxylesterase